MIKKVAVGVVFNDHREVLIAKRPHAKFLGGLWEFPGGKLDPGEDAFTALKRELYEELRITVISAQPLLQYQHSYGDKIFDLDVWQVDRFTGTAMGAEGQEIAWVPPTVLPSLSMLEGNVKIIDRLLRCSISENSLALSTDPLTQF